MSTMRMVNQWSPLTFLKSGSRREKLRQPDRLAIFLKEYQEKLTEKEFRRLKSRGAKFRVTDYLRRD